MYGQGPQYPQTPGQQPQPNPYGPPPGGGYPPPPQQPQQPQQQQQPYGAPAAPPQGAPGYGGGGPYGQPQQPPYGGQPYGGGQPPYGGQPYGQPPYGQAPYGRPPQGYPQQQPPYGPPSGGRPPVAQPRSRKGLVIGIVAAVVVLGVGGVAAAMLSGGGDEDISGKYKIATPATLPGGYAVASHKEAPASDSQTAGFGTEMTTVGAEYVGGSPRALLTLAGAYGKIADPEQAITTKLNATLAEKKTRFSEPLRNFPAKDPRDSGGLLRCGQLQTSKGDMPVCFWANHATMSLVIFTLQPTSDGGTAQPLDLAKAADQTRTIRDGVVQHR
ncbi:hypothetical protein ACIQGZ_18120 [Streptomyces sp. NPDC092296]|uniref:hypothetical protein n=1 Tax=Streptomyces sp. NPDC092296 TaxID=3366012 RepID=UPI00380BD514